MENAEVKKGHYSQNIQSFLAKSNQVCLNLSKCTNYHKQFLKYFVHKTVYEYLKKEITPRFGLAGKNTGLLFLHKGFIYQIARPQQHDS